MVEEKVRSVNYFLGGEAFSVHGHRASTGHRWHLGVRA